MDARFSQFQSICPDCGQPVPAAYMRRNSAVYLEKNCPVHGESRALASEDADMFERWLAFPSVTVPPRVFITEGAGSAEQKEMVHLSRSQTEGGGAENAEDTDAGILNTECPLHCGVCENHLMTACCVLLNVTERCNQHCPYCFANAEQAGILSDGVKQDPSLAEIDRRLDRLIELGEDRKFNIQLSGGEPTVRDDLHDIIRMCAAKGFEYIQLNTNGRRLGEDAAYAGTLKAAGLSTVFLQFDGVDDEVFLALRGEPLLDIKKAAIKNCGKAGLPVTLVPTILKNTNLAQTGAIIDFMLDHITVVKGVHFQPASFFGRKPDERNTDGDFDERVTMFAIMEEIEKQTGERIVKADLAPISTGHPLCCFCAAFMKEKDGGVRPLSSGGSCCGSEQEPLEIIRRDRDFVLNKWNISAPDNFSPFVPADAMNFDEAIAMFKNNMFTISGMAFMDETNLDAERLRRCRVQVFSPDERLIPFCGYYATRRMKGI
jgi:uncharacterized radical SAM superfamily Fe-S cluster-containing enzyme